jgi:hypothetical protein
MWGTKSCSKGKTTRNLRMKLNKGFVEEKDVLLLQFPGLWFSEPIPDFK